MRVLGVASSREIDRRATEDFAIPSLVLMENAALGIVEGLDDSFPNAERVLILCGPGNNGGDGLALARHLDLRGLDTKILLVGERALAGDAAIQESICRRQGLDLERLTSAAGLPTDLGGWDLVVDALFGVGLKRPLHGLHAAVAKWVNAQPAPCLAIDLPSGLSGDSARPDGIHVVADVTVTFETPKPAHVLPPACDAVGELIVADLGIPSAVAETVPGDLQLATPELAAGWLGVRRPGAHKGEFGHVLVVAGSPGMGGAAVLAARGAVRGGAGLVTCAVPQQVLTTVDAASLESMTLGLPATDGGELSAEALEPVLAAAEQRHVLAVGPGLGEGAGAAALVLGLVARCQLPLVLDAGALAPLVGRLDLLRDREAPTVLTPHAGELARLLGVPTADVTADRVGFVRQAVEQTAAVVLLKGQATLVGDSAGIVINSTGNPGMATGGSGDVLTGLIAALVSRRAGAGPLGGRPLELREAAALGAFVHGAAGDLAAEALGETALTATDLLARLPQVLKALESA